MDDTLLYLRDTFSSLQIALWIIYSFGIFFSSIKINWGSSFYSHSTPRLQLLKLLHHYAKLKYLGAEEQNDASEFVDNPSPLLCHLTLKYVAWMSLPLRPVGHVLYSFKKYILMSQFLYLSLQTPKPIPIFDNWL